MAKLDARQRNALPKSDFGLPGQRAYPMPDRAHAANAKVRAAQHATPTERAKIDAKANKILRAEHGSTRVPGHPQPKARDTVPAMLSPGEAVLNRGAAEAMGRPAIAAANHAHLGDNSPSRLPTMDEHADKLHPHHPRGRR